jgi:hypothetical protein
MEDTPMNPRILTTAISALLLASCSTLDKKQELTADQLRAKLHGNTVVVEPVTNPVMLVERTKSKAIGNAVISSVVSIAAGRMGSSGGSVHHTNLQQLEARLDSQAEISQAFSKSAGEAVSNALPTGTEVGSGNGVDLALSNKLNGYFSSKPSDENVHGASPITVSVMANLWELGYESMLTSSDYALNYDLRLSIDEKDGDKTKPLKQIVCQGTATDKMPLEQWKAENYQKVDASIPKIVDECFNLAMAEMGLN